MAAKKKNTSKIHADIEHKQGRIVLRSGHFYTFKYKGWENDPAPFIIFLNAVSGIHPNTGHQHRYIQGINLNYIPSKDRKRFIKDYIDIYNKNVGKSIKFTWKDVKSKYPYLQYAVRRYFYKPVYYISGLEEIVGEAVEDAIKSSSGKDFSKKIKQQMAAKMRELEQGKLKKSPPTSANQKVKKTKKKK